MVDFFLGWKAPSLSTCRGTPPPRSGLSGFKGWHAVRMYVRELPPVFMLLRVQ